ncbi:MAG: taurine--2-oxoglutarate transaminase [Verrucomicrobiales bacterium]|jgi:taurine--2-oxoglutarate transaminase
MNPTEIAATQARHTMRCWSAQAGYAPVSVARAEGCWIHTHDGRKIFDLRSAHECINLGFNHPQVLSAMKAQMEQVLYVTDDFATAATAELSQKLAELTPGTSEKKVYFSQSGASAVEAAIKAARLYQYNRVFHEDGTVDAPSQYPYPYKIISRYNSWHGATSGAASASGDPRRWFQEPLTVPGVVFAPDANPYRPHFESLDRHFDYLNFLIEQEGGRNKVAAFLLEPIVGSNGIILPPDGYLERVRELCDHWDLLMIVDETMTGMGRTGKFLAIEHWNVEPDIIVMGKALGAYCPLAATILSEKVAKSFDHHLFGHGQSYSGHALACAGALAAINVLHDDGLLEHAQKMGNLLGEALRALGQKHSSVGDVRGLGLFWTMELVADQITKKPLRRATEKYEDTIVKRVSDFLFQERQVYVPSDKFGLWIVPPLIVNEEEIAFLLAAIDDALTLADSLLSTT